MSRQWLPALLSVAVLAGAQVCLSADDKDPLKDTRDRMKIEAQRVEKVFAGERAAAYKLVRSDNPKLAEATEKLQTLLSMIRKDVSLEARRRKVLLVTLEWDLDKVKEIADQRRRASTNSTLSRTVRSTIRRDDDRRPIDNGSISRDARSIIESRSRDVSDSRLDRSRAADRFNRVGRSVDKSATADTRGYSFPRDWKERVAKRSSGIKLTAKEKAIMEALKKVIGVDYSNNSFEEVIDSLKKQMKCEIVVDKRGLDEANVTYQSQVTLRMRGTTRTVLKRILADLGLAYVVKDEAILITSLERARQMTTVRTYYIGDLAANVNVNIPPALNQLIMMQTVNQMITLITKNVDPQSWKVNNPDAPGTIVFNPLNMTLVVKQTAEIHYMLAGK